MLARVTRTIQRLSGCFTASTYSNIGFTNELDFNTKLASLIEDTKINKVRDEENKEAVFVIGPLGSGKSTFIRNCLESDSRVTVSTDDYMGELYDPKITLRDLHRETRKLGIMYTDYLANNGYSMLMEGTGNNDDIWMFLDDLKRYDYNLVMYTLDTPLDVCINRVMNRNLTTERKVSIESTIDSYKLLEIRKDRLKTAFDEVHPIDFHIDNTFNSNEFTIFPDAVEVPGEYEIKNELQLFQSSTEYTLKKLNESSSPLLASVLHALQALVPAEEFANLRIDTRSSMLAPGWVPSIPGWHCDFVTRINDRISPDKDNDGEVNHYLLVSGDPETEFLKNRHISLYHYPNDWNIVNKHVNSLEDMRPIRVPPMHFIKFTGNELHRALPAYHAHGMRWRYLFRASSFPKHHPAFGNYVNEIRTQNQVYVDMSSPGW